MAYDPQRVVASIEAILGRPAFNVLPPQDIHAARIHSGMEVLRAIARNSQNGYFGSLSALVTLTHNQFLPAHDGEPGIPRIVPFEGAEPRDGIPADPDEIDSYRNDSTDKPLFTGALDGKAIPHDRQDANGLLSPLSCRYSIVNGVFKFTGFSAQIPLIQLTRSMADTGVPENYEPTVIKLTIPQLVRADDKLYQLAMQYQSWGQQDLLLIQKGEMQVPPVPAVTQAQKAII